MYGETLKLFQRESIKQLWDREWIPRISGKQAGYAGLAEYHQSRVSSFRECVVRGIMGGGVVWGKDSL